MSLGEQAQQATGDVEGPPRRRLVGAPLDAYEVRRLLLIAGCIAAAATANFAGSALPQRAPVAVGAALLGVLLVLRRRPAGDLTVPESDLIEVEAVDAPSVTRVPRGHRRARAEKAAALDAGLSDVRHQLEAHEDRLTSLSGRQTLIDTHAREQLGDLQRRIEDLELARQELVGLSNRMRNEHNANLQQLQTLFVEHQQAITQLVATYIGNQRPERR